MPICLEDLLEAAELGGPKPARFVHFPWVQLQSGISVYGLGEPPMEPVSAI